MSPPAQDPSTTIDTVVPSVPQREPASNSALNTAGPLSPSVNTPGRDLETSPSPEALELSPMRRSSCKRKPVERFKFDKAHGYSNIKRYVNSIVKTLVLLPCAGRAYHANYTLALTMDPIYGVLHAETFSPDFLIKNPSFFRAKKGSDPDTPSIGEALSGQYCPEFIKAMRNEIDELVHHQTWEVIKRSDIQQEEKEDGSTFTPPVLPNTWAFKVKRYPSGLLRKIKARFCCRGDQQVDVDPFDTYAPVASWSSIHMLTVTTLQRGWVTKQIDFSNAFVQAPMEHNVYIALPTMFGDTNNIPAHGLCLHLKKSLYGLREAPKLWADWLAKGLADVGFTPSDNDPGIFYGRGMALIVYMDDVLLLGPDESEMEKVLAELHDWNFDLKIEKDGSDASYDFLGINITRKDDEIIMTQYRLIKKFLECVGCTNANRLSTPAASQPLGSDVNGPSHEEEWEYASAVGMLMYLAGNAYPEIQFAVHQCARFTHAPQRSHTVAIKCIDRYLVGVLEDKEDLHFKTTTDLNLYLYVDADFAGLWTYEDDQDPVCVKSHTGYVMTLGGCPVLWTSKLQTEISLSTLETEYIAMAQAMREFVPLCRMYEEMLTQFGLASKRQASVIQSKIFEDNNGCIFTAEAPKLSPRTKHIAIKYHFVRNYFNKNPTNCMKHPFVLKKIDTLEQKADIFTKGLKADTFLILRKLLCGW